MNNEFLYTTEDEYILTKVKSASTQNLICGNE